MDRRDFIGVLIGSSLFSPMAPAHLCNAGASALASTPVRNIPSGFDSRSLANEYLKICPQFRERPTLMNGIFGAEAGHAAELRTFADERSACAFLSESIAKDFERGATLRVGGWVYAEMELKLCALQALSVA